jgi:diguanylate cyclase (GGDEF)-like protein
MSPPTATTNPGVTAPNGRAAGAFLVGGLAWVAADLAGVLGPASEYTFLAIAVATLIASQIGITRYRPVPQWPWRLLTLAVVVFLVGGGVKQAVQSFGDLSPSRSLVPDYIIVPGYVLVLIAFVGFLRGRWRHRGHDVDAVLDSAVIALAALAAAWVYLMTPALSQDDLTIAVRISLAIYPPLSVFLAALSLRLAFAAGGRSSVAQRLFVVMMFAMVTGDVVSTIGDAHLFAVPKRLADLPYAVAFISLGVITLHPSMGTLADEVPDDETRPLRGRLALIMVALGIPAVVLQFYGDTTRNERLVLGGIVMALTVLAVIRVARALHQHAQSEALMRYQATHDELTGLPNRSRVLALIDRKLAQPARTHGLAVLFVDIDRFKLVNDTSGHAVGDELLLAIARRLSGCMREGQIAARLGGDEFVVVLDDVEDVAAVLAEAEALRAALELPFDIRGLEIFSSASIGVVVADPTDERRNPDALVQDADTAMYQVKTSGGGGVAVFDTAMRDELKQRLLLEQDLHKAIARDEFRLYYQPIVQLGTGTVDGFEALIRWHHPARGLVPPTAFIPVAEETGLIVAIGDWVLQEASRQLAEWRHTLPHGERLGMAVNVSARQLRSPLLVGRVAHALAAHAIPPQALCIELTESTLTDDPHAAAAVLAQIRELGVSLSLDDFGTGYSSLSYLKRFAVDSVKIDKSFVDDLGGDGGSEEPLVAAIIAMADALNLSTVAEGVEHPAQEAKLRELGATKAQGYLFSRPLPADVIPAALSRLAECSGERTVTPALVPTER